METIQVPGYPDPIQLDSIIWLEGDASYTRLHQQEGKMLLVTQSLHTFEHYPGLLRVHRSAIVNTLHVEKFVHQKSRLAWVELVDQTRVAVSRTYLPVIAARLNHLDSVLTY